MRLLRSMTVASSVVSLLVGGVILAPSAKASAEWSALQASVPFTVYEAYETFSMPRTVFEVNTACNMSDSNIAVVYRTSSTKKIKLYESSGSCFAGGGSYAPIEFTSFPVQGGAATAVVYPACRTQLQCEFPSNRTLRERGARIEVTLSSDGVHSATKITIKTQGISLANIKKFVWSLGLP